MVIAFSESSGMMNNMSGAANKDASHLVSNFSIRALLSVREEPSDERGLMFVGLDVIGDRITEINVTSPTCVREIERAYDINITGELFDAIEAKLN